MAINSATSNANTTSLSSTEEPAAGTTQDNSPSLPQIPPLGFGLLGPDEATRRALTPIVEVSVSERGPPTVEAAVPSSPPLGNSSGTNNTSAFSPSMERREASEGLSLARISSPSAYTPTEGVSVAVSLLHEKSEESVTNTGIPRPNSEAWMSLTGGGSTQQPSIDNNGTPVGRVPSPASAHSLHSSVASPPSLSPANSSNPPASLSPALALPRTPSPKYSILTSPHSAKESPARPSQSFADLGTESLGGQPLTPRAVLHAASLEPSKMSQDSVQTSTDSSRDATHGIFDEAGALYYLHQSEQDSLSTNPEPAQEGNDKSEIPQPSRYIPPAINIAPLRPKTTSPPPPNSARSLLSIDTAHRKPPTQQLPRTPTLDYGPERRPAGARAAPVSNHRQDSLSPSTLQPHNPSIRTVGNVPQGNMSQMEDLEAYAAAMTFYERDDDDAPAPAPSAPSAATSPPPQPREGLPAISEPNLLPQTPESENASVYKSSFAPSKNAMQRKARTEAQQAAHEAATHRPGRATGKPKNKPKTVGTWGDSSEEEEDEEDDEDDEDVDSDGQPVAPRDDRSVSNYAASVNQRSRVPSPRGPSPFASGVDVPPPLQPMPRPPRNLPPVPVLRGQGMSLALPTLRALALTVSVT
jgi:CCR4-NOT transcriptional complex subunit CAF120